MRTDGYCTLGVDREYDLDEAALLKAMDAAGVDRAIVGAAPRRMAVRNHEGNDFILRAAAANPSRFIPTCTANPWLGGEAIEEARRAIGEGAQMLVLDPVVQGFGLGDDLAYPLIEAATDCGVPVYVHTGGYHHGTPAQLGLTARRFPRTTFIMGHCGSCDFKVDAVEVARGHPNIFAETSLTRSFGAVSLVEALGDRRVIMGSAAPLNDLVFEWRETIKLIPEQDHPGFYGGTIQSLLRGDAG